MFFPILATAATLLSFAAASSVRTPYLPSHKAPSPRPTLPFGPHQPWRPFPHSPSRSKICYVPSHNDGMTDDSPAIIEALHKCNNGGHIVFPKPLTYTIGTALDMSFLRQVDLDIQGTWRFTNNTDYWQAHGFKFTFQNATTFFQLGGSDVNVFGGGTLDGNGQAWYDLYAKNDLILRPILFGTIGLNCGSISDLTLLNSPQWFNFLANSTDVVFSGLSMKATSNDANFIANTDGWDVYRSSNIVIQNSTIDNGDDCVSFKPNATQILVQNLHCNGSHGVSVGSLGQYVGEVDIVEDVLVSNIHMSNASDGARIKVWPGVPSELSGDLQGGGGSGMVKNIKYDGMYITNVDYAIEVTQCYGQSNQTLCNEFPANLTIADVLFTNFYGTTSKAHSPISGTVVCSAPNVCSNITATNIDVVSPAGTTDEFVCVNVDDSTLAVNCSATA